jgi:hypothetical protein
MFFRSLLFAVGVQQTLFFVNAGLGTTLDVNNTDIYLPHQQLADEGVEVIHLGQKIIQNITEMWRFIEKTAVPQSINEQTILSHMNFASNEIQQLETKVRN